ncbi:BRISC and BRCA1-A complex member 1 [Labeo rohita]|uniref:BRISC and BRCA1-A complex member 1 n=1 Tax=Labeo rohita TaxID=84645 RepID=A0ABQ8M9Q3_LABRO|nr:BRISC and BRCA1-A complex member 1 [Labeo rohita]
METPEPGQADGEERMMELRPRTRSNPEGAEDRRSSTGSLNNSLASPPQPAVGSRVEGEGEAASTDSPPPSASAITAAAPAPVTAAGNSTASMPAMASAVKERPKPPQPSMSTQIPPSAELHLRAPRVNCPEKVIICLDLSEEMSLQKLESFNGSKTNALNISQKMIEMFVRTKHKIDKRHEFALVVVNDDAMWKIELPQMENIQTIPPPFVVRTLLIFSRHAGMLQFNPSDAAKSPYFFFDVVYLHNGTEEQTEDTSWKDVYASFSELDSKGMCYRFEVSLCGPAIELHNCMAKLLCHPLQRPFQSHASYSLLEDDDTQENEATTRLSAASVIASPGSNVLPPPGLLGEFVIHSCEEDGRSPLLSLCRKQFQMGCFDHMYLI